MGRVTARLPDDVSAVGPQEEVRIGIGDLMDGCRRIEGNEKRVQGSRQGGVPAKLRWPYNEANSVAG